MRHVEVKITSDDPSDQNVVHIAILQDRGAGDVRIDGRDYVVNLDTVMVFDLNPGQKLDIMNPATVALTDPDQFVAHDPAQQTSPAAREQGKVDRPKIPVEPNKSHPPVSAPPGTHEVKPRVEPSKTMTNQPTSTGAGVDSESPLAPSGAKPLPTQTVVPAAPSSGGDKK